ncbi:MAG: hypothetical protein ACYSUP_18825 [Planctomycetota bacterium]|jgi:hypothetical protein
MASIEQRLADLQKRVLHLEAENKRMDIKLKLVYRLAKENHANIQEYLKATLFSEDKDKT